MRDNGEKNPATKKWVRDMLMGLSYAETVVFARKKDDHELLILQDPGGNEYLVLAVR